ncbi:MAG: putative zinc metalloprotease ywhC [Frankiales bacterium]|nr:putative zinc metalloprotease ywhC [Frankiales bacterium]
MSYSYAGPSRARVRPSPIFLVVVVIAIGSGWWAWHADNSVTRGSRFAVFLFVVAAWVVTLCLHEFAHAFSAWRFGDTEVEARGYLTLNPLKYSHPVLSIVLPIVFIALGGIGLPGGAVFIHPNQFRTRFQRAVVSLVGPATNALSAIVLLIVFAGRSAASDDHQVFWAALAFLAFLQLMAAILNLLPIPGLDGWGVIEPYLDPGVQRGAEQFKPWGMIILYALLQINSVNNRFFDAIYRLFDLLGGNDNIAYTGRVLFQFWQKLG